jgi:cytoskeletal protein RodZ
VQNFTIKYVIAVLVILFVLGGAILVLWPDKQSSKQTAHKPTTTEVANPKPDTSASKPPSTQTAPKTSSNTQAATPTETKKPANSSQLADTGPGETVGMFVAVSALFASGHWYLQRRNLLRD